MKRIACLITAFAMLMTIIAVPSTSVSYADATTPPAVEDVPATDAPEESAPDVEMGSVTISGIEEEYIYTGNAITPVPEVTYNDTALVAGTDYDLYYFNNRKVGTATLLFVGKGIYKGEKEVTFNIKKADVKNVNITLPYTNANYTGYAIKPVPKVVVDGKALRTGEEFKISYKKNIYPGVATVIVEGVNHNFLEERTFTIGKVNNLNLTNKGITKLTVSWAANKKVTGYQLQRFNGTLDKWVTWSFIENPGQSSVVASNLEDGSIQKFRIRSYVKDENGKYHFSEWSNEVTAATYPGKVKLTSLTTNIRMHLQIKWEKRNCSGYEIYVAGDSQFTNPTIYNIKASSIGSTGIQAKTDNKTYYVKMRAYKVFEGKRLYGAWSNTKKITTDGTGWFKSKGATYFFKKGKPFTGYHKIEGNPYYFDKDGALVGTSAKMYKAIKNKKSKTNWLVSVDTKTNKTIIFHKVDGKWAAKYYIKSSTGKKSTKTPTGTFVIPKKNTHDKYYGDKYGYRCLYKTRLNDKVAFHSILFQPKSNTKVKDGRLGANVTTGCIRMSVKDAKWFYSNIHAGTTVVILPMK